MFLIAPAAYMGIVMQMPLRELSAPWSEQFVYHFLFQPMNVSLCSATVCHLWILVLGGDKSAGHRHNTIILVTFSCTLYFVIVESVLARFVFPVPMGMLWIAGSDFTFGFLATMLRTLPIAYIMKSKVKMLRLVLSCWLPVIFFVVFGAYRAAFIRMDGLGQACLAPMWPLIKICFKFAVTRLLKGTEPDVAPIIKFLLDVGGALCTNFLFTKVVDLRSFFMMLLVDVIENLSIALRCMFCFQAHERRLSSDKQIMRDEAILSLLRSNAERLDNLSRDSPFAIHRDSFTDIESVGDDTVPGERVCVETMGRATVDSIADTLLPTSLSAEPRPFSTNVDVLEKRLCAVRELDSLTIDLEETLCLVLNLFSSEISEVVSSLWSGFLMYVVYAGPNRDFWDPTVGVSMEELRRACLLSCFDAFLEGILFVGLVVLIRLVTRIEVIAVGWSFVRFKQFRSTLIFVSAAACIVASVFFVHHAGVDVSLILR